MFSNINLTKDLKSLNLEDLKFLCTNIREEIITAVFKNGGHLSSNLGVVELTVMIHYLFDLPKDKLLFDVGHQCYTHKLLTGRSLKKLRKSDGVSGFLSINESIYDSYETGHAGTALSTAIGMAIARDLKKENNEIIALVGDASLANGLSLEALNHLSDLNNKVIIIINDNQMSISQNFGGINKLLNDIRLSHLYLEGKNILKGESKVKRFIYKNLKLVKDSLKRSIDKENWLENLGFNYIGVVDGHNLEKLKEALEIAKNSKESIIVHVSTVKGKGYKDAEEDKLGDYHGVGARSTSKEKDKVSWSEVVSESLLTLASSNDSLCVITPAMVNGSKLANFFNKYPKRSFDVGIAEEHALTLASGLALNGLLPFVSIYSTFLQRGYDMLSHDLARMNSNVVIGVDRAGIIGQDGSSHQGIFDVALALTLPNSRIAMPLIYSDISKLLINEFNYRGVSFIRYPRERITRDNKTYKIEVANARTLNKKKNAMKAIIGIGPLTNKLADKIKELNLDIDVYGFIYIRPLDEKLLLNIAKQYTEIIIYDPYSIKTGLYSEILDFYNSNNIKIKLEFIGIPLEFLPHGETDEILDKYKLSIDEVIKRLTGE